ncbi:MAG: hypothetical protein [Caudoviricetes sp.]|nr:MAG: hypothetical protein [Caudoviricetes sp.]
MPLEHGFFPPYGGDDKDGVGTHKDWLTLTPKQLNEVPIDNDYDDGVEISQKDKATQMVIRQRNAYRKIVFSRYHEIILNIRDYINVPVSFNKLKCEYFLRNGLAVAVGKDAVGTFQLLGTVNDTNTVTNSFTPYGINELTGKDINFILPKRLIPPDLSNYKEITELDNAKTGDFVILRNKPFTFTNDMAIINFYADRLAELMASRLSLILQAKVTSVIPVENGNSEDADQIVANLMNGAPYLIMNKDRMRLKDMVVTIGDSSIPERIKTLKTAFNDEQNELNNLLGINTVGVDKASGVSEKEADSNNDYVTSTTNMYIRGVQHGLDLYNARFNKNMYVYMNQPSLAELKIGGFDGSDNN